MDNERAGAHVEGLKLLARRELSVEALRVRLLDRGFASAEIEAAIARLLESGALDDARVARAHARTAVTVRGRGRLRVLRELHQMGIDPEVAGEALGEVFGDVDERALIAQAIQKKLRGQAPPTDRAAFARLYQYLMRQGFSPAGVGAALRRFRGAAGLDQD